MARKREEKNRVGREKRRKKGTGKREGREKAEIG